MVSAPTTRRNLEYGFVGQFLHHAVLVATDADNVGIPVVAGLDRGKKAFETHQRQRAYRHLPVSNGQPIDWRLWIFMQLKLSGIPD